MQDSEVIFDHFQYYKAINQFKILNTKQTESQSSFSAVFQALPGWLNDRGATAKSHFPSKNNRSQQSKVIDLLK